MTETAEKYHKIPVKPQDSFTKDSFRTIDISPDEGIKAVIGKLESDPSGSIHVQSYLFDVDRRSMEEGKKWVEDHKQKGSTERRTYEASEIRMTFDKGQARITGLAIPYNTINTNPIPEAPNVKERILPGAFRESVEGTDDVLFLLQHDTRYVFGRKRSGTLKLHETDKGVVFENTPPDISWARDAIVSIKRQDITNMSFGFAVPHGGADYLREGDDIVRNVRNGRLFEVSLCTFPVYESTTVVARAAGAIIVDGVVLEDPHYVSEEDAKKLDEQNNKFKISDERFQSLREKFL